MRFKEYTWPYNPESFTATWARKLAVHKIPFGRYCLQDLGRTCRILQGEGTFTGERAYAEFQKLAGVFCEDGPGLLVHPVFQAASAYFVSLQMKEEPLPQYVRYTFEFWEDGVGNTGLKEIGGSSDDYAASTSKSAEPVSYTVRRGDTLWGIAGQYGVALSALISANPQIKNPNLIYPGEKVRIP
jgi:spore coat assembly protein SafA